MSILGEVRSLFADTFLSLPLIIIGFIFLFGTLTSNVGLLYLFIGQLILPPALSYLSSPAANLNGWATPVSDLFYKYVPAVLVLLVNLSSLGGGLNFLVYLLLILPLLGQTMEINKPFMFFLNPIGWYRHGMDYKDEEDSGSSASSACAMLPGTDKPRRNPSVWITHMTFLFGFILANARTIYNEPTPEPKIPSNNPKYQEELGNISKRVNNRKKRVISVMVATVILFLIIFTLRYKLTQCEGSFAYSLIPNIFSGLTGAAWFSILHETIGIRPTDILGIVQGMISPNMSSNPIICVGD
jgi:hypothetical protein